MQYVSNATLETLLGNSTPKLLFFLWAFNHYPALKALVPTFVALLSTILTLLLPQKDRIVNSYNGFK